MQQKIENAIQESVETLIVLNQSIRHLVEEGCSEEEIKAISTLVSALSELTTSLSQMGYMKHLGSSSKKVERTVKPHIDAPSDVYVDIGRMVAVSKEKTKLNVHLEKAEEFRQLLEKADVLSKQFEETLHRISSFTLTPDAPSTELLDTSEGSATDYIIDTVIKRIETAMEDLK